MKVDMLSYQKADLAPKQSSVGPTPMLEDTQA